jgi:aspartate/methionine/tyrosine aminotransferase
MFELAKKLEAKGRKIYHLEVGEPDFPTPANVVEAGIKALNEGHTKYVSSRGTPPLLDAITDYYNTAKRILSLHPEPSWLCLVESWLPLIVAMRFYVCLPHGQHIAL